MLHKLRRCSSLEDKLLHILYHKHIMGVVRWKSHQFNGQHINILQKHRTFELTAVNYQLHNMEISCGTDNSKHCHPL